MISVFPVQFPPSNTPVVDEKGSMNNSGMAFFRALYNRTGQGNGLINQVNASVSGDGALLSADWNLVTGLSPNVLLPSLTGGQAVVVQNNSGFGTNILPPVGGTIDGAANYSLADSKMQIFWFFSSTIIKSTQLG